MVRVWLDIIVSVGIANPKKLLKETEKHPFYRLNNEYKLIGEIITTKELMECE